MVGDVHERLSIGVFARRSGLSVSALRFYADRGLLAPAAVDPSSGYRSYDEGQLDDAVLIRELRLLGLPLAEVGAFLTAKPVDRRALVDGRVVELERQLDHARTVARAIHTRLDRSETSMNVMTVGARELRAATDQVLPAVGADPERPMLAGVLIEARQGSLRLVATDSYRLVIRDIPSRVDTVVTLRAVIGPAELRSWRDDLEGDGEVAVTIEAHQLVVRGAGYERRSGLLPDAFPAYEAILEGDALHGGGAGTALVADRLAVLAALERYAEQGDAVLLHLHGDRLELIRREERTELAVRHRGEDRHVALDPRYAADSVRAAVGPEVVVEIGGPLQPVVIRSADDGTYTAMLMPVRLA
jgi:DNA-binding transcriptional MerR regulator